jgi:hypothetical protein
MKELIRPKQLGVQSGRRGSQKGILAYAAFGGLAGASRLSGFVLRDPIAQICLDF